MNHKTANRIYNIDRETISPKGLMPRLSEGEQNRLVIEHVEIIAPIAARFRGKKDIPFEELEAEGMLALVACAKSFNPDRAQFITFATHYINGYLKNFVERWQVMDQLDDVSDEDEDRIHEWQIWGIFPAEGYRRLPCAPSDIVRIYKSISKGSAMTAAMLSLSRRERKMVGALFEQSPPLCVDQIARNMKCSYYDAVETLYDAVKKLRETVKRIERNKFLHLTKAA